MVLYYKIETRRNVLISLLPKWAEEILSGDKKWEYRRIRIKAQPESRIIFYASKRLQAIVGEAIIEKVICAPIELLIRQTINEVLETPEDLRESFKGKEIGCAIKIKSPIKYKKPVTLQEIREKIPGFRPPQSFYYISDENPLIQML
jgi:predicted transcriptional regulator